MILGLNFSKRKDGNCRGVLNLLKESKVNMEIFDVSDLNISSCCDYNYACFSAGHCVCKDDMELLKEKIKDAKEIFIVVPVYRGHLCSNYFKIHERLTGDYRLDDDRLKADYLNKATYFVLVNRNAGLEQAVSELTSDIESYGGTAKIYTISSRDYGESSITGRLVDNQKFRNFIETLT